MGCEGGRGLWVAGIRGGICEDAGALSAARRSWGRDVIGVRARERLLRRPRAGGHGKAEAKWQTRQRDGLGKVQRHAERALPQRRSKLRRRLGPRDRSTDEGGRGLKCEPEGNGRDSVHGRRASVQWAGGKALLFHVSHMHWCNQRQSQGAQICARYARYVCTIHWQHAASRLDFFYF